MSVDYQDPDFHGWALILRGGVYARTLQSLFLALKWAIEEDCDLAKIWLDGYYEMYWRNPWANDEDLH